MAHGRASNHKDLKVCKKSIDLVTDIYRITSYFPGPERYGLTIQMRRAAVSVPSNIAERRGQNLEEGKFPLPAELTRIPRRTRDSNDHR